MNNRIQILVSFAAITLLAGCGVGLCVDEQVCLASTSFDNGTFGVHEAWGGPVYRSLVLADKVVLQGPQSAYGTTKLGTIGAVDLSGNFLPSFYSVARPSFDFITCFEKSLDGTNRFWIAGNFPDLDGQSLGSIALLKPTGELDTTFASGTGFTGWPVYSLAPARDGSGDVYVAGSFGVYNGVANLQNLARLNADGTLDVAFNVLWPAGNFTSGGFTRKIVALDDGSGDVLILGDFTQFAGVARPGAVRINPNGTRDATFNPATGFSAMAQLRSVAVIPGTANVYVAGQFTTYNGGAASDLIRILANGTRDATFVTGTGFSYTGGTPVIAQVAMAADATGDIYVSGDFTSYDGTAVPGFVRLQSSGAIRTSFLGGTGFNSTIAGITPTSDGSGDIYVTGLFSRYNGQDVKSLARIASDGSLRSGYAAKSQFVGPVFSIESVGDGRKLYFGGQMVSYAGETTKQIALVNYDGTLDTSFTTGEGFKDPSNYHSINALLKTPEGGVFAGGLFSTYRGAAAGSLIKLAPNGDRVASFDTGTGFDTSVSSLAYAADSSGDIYVGGGFGTLNGAPIPRGIVRLNSNGTLDSGFNGTGFDFGGEAKAILALKDGSGDILVAGTFTSYNGVAAGGAVRINSDGSIDNSFSAGVGTVAGFYAAYETSNGYLLGGSVTNYNGVVTPSLIRVTKTGALDSSFVFQDPTAGLFISSIAPYQGIADQFYVSGYKPGSFDSTILVVKPDGSLDAGFQSGNGFTQSTYVIHAAQDGTSDVYVGGAISDYNGTAVDSVARLSPTGQLE